MYRRNGKIVFFADLRRNAKPLKGVGDRYDAQRRIDNLKKILKEDGQPAIGRDRRGDP